MPPESPSLPWLAPGQDFPPADQAWGESSPAPGLLAAGGVLDVETLCNAYAHGIFPWFSEGQPILWWSTSPRMTLEVRNFRLHRSLKKTLLKFQSTQGCEIRMDTAFDQVIQACSSSKRTGQGGTWILPVMVDAYCALHRAGFAHSVETWVNGELAGGLYCIVLGKAVFGESMFSRQADASKIALAALVAFCRHHGIHQIDCQQNTKHLASMGAREMTRDRFIREMAVAQSHTTPAWHFAPLYWRQLLPEKPNRP